MTKQRRTLSARFKDNATSLTLDQGYSFAEGSCGKKLLQNRGLSAISVFSMVLNGLKSAQIINIVSRFMSIKCILRANCGYNLTLRLKRNYCLCISRILSFENHVYRAGNTNKVRKVADTKPPTITIANGR